MKTGAPCLQKRLGYPAVRIRVPREAESLERAGGVGLACLVSHDLAPGALHAGLKHKKGRWRKLSRSPEEEIGAPSSKGYAADIARSPLGLIRPFGRRV